MSAGGDLVAIPNRAPGVPLLISSDSRPAALIQEAAAEVGNLAPAGILLLLTTQTPRAIFPGRQIGYLRDGWEASFIVLSGDPLADPAQCKT